MTAAWESTFVASLRRRRENHGLTQTDLARLVKDYGLPFHQQTVARIESGSRPVRLDEAMVIARLLSSSLEEMLADSPPLPEVTSPDEEVGAAIRATRKAAGVTQQELRDRLVALGWKIGSTALSGIENGSRALRVNQVYLIAAALNTTASSLLLAGEEGTAP